MQIYTFIHCYCSCCFVSRISHETISTSKGKKTLMKNDQNHFYGQIFHLVWCNVWNRQNEMEKTTRNIRNKKKKTVNCVVRVVWSSSNNNYHVYTNGSCFSFSLALNWEKLFLNDEQWIMEITSGWAEWIENVFIYSISI